MGKKQSFLLIITDIPAWKIKELDE